MIVIIQHFAKRSAINHRLVTLEARTLFAFEGFDRDRPKLNSFHGLPRFLIAFEDLDSVETSIAESLEKSFFR